MRMRIQPRSGSSKVRRWLDNALLMVVIAVFALGAAAVVSGEYQVRPVLSGSMEPSLPVGGVVVTERVPTSTLRVHDVVVFHHPNRAQELVVHRIVTLTPGAGGPVVQTKGDANALPDASRVSLRGQTAYRAIFAVPLIGYVAVWAHGPAGRKSLMLLGLLLIVGAAASSLLQLRRSRKTPARSAGQLTPHTGTPSSANVNADMQVENDEALPTRRGLDRTS